MTGLAVVPGLMHWGSVVDSEEQAAGWRWLLEEHGALLLGVLPVASFVISLVSLPLAVALVPADYFVRGTVRRESRAHPLWWMTGFVLRNLLGAILILGGIAMLVLPGQGILTILLGLMLVHFPGKRRLESWLVSRRGVRPSIQWLRQKAGREPLRFDDPAPAPHPPESSGDPSGQ